METQSKIFWSPLQRGFYHSDVHSTIPEDGVEISRELHQELLAAQNAGCTIITGPKGKPLAQAPATVTIEQLRATALIEVRRARASIMSILDGLQASRLALKEEASAKKIEAVKKALRDVTATDTSACTDMESLRAAYASAYSAITDGAESAVTKAFVSVLG